jgi:predicted nucleic acid-binding protein
LRAVCDTGPLFASITDTDEAHALATDLMSELGRDALIPESVVVEVDQLLRSCAAERAARAFLAAVSAGEHTVAYITPGLLRRAVEIDARFADLHLGFVDVSVMAVAEREELPVLTFDFRDFRAAPPERRRAWQLVIDEDRYARAVRLK